MNDIRENIRSVIKDRELKQRTVARKAGIDESKFSAVMCLRRRLDIAELLGICDFLGMTVEELRNYRSDSRTA